MAEEPGVSEGYRRASPWPLVVVLGFVLSELGVLFGVPPVAVGGLLLFGGSVAGIVRESGYASSLWSTTLVVGVLFAAAGGLVFFLTDADLRGIYVAAAGLLLAAGGVVLLIAAAFDLLEPDRTRI